MKKFKFLFIFLLMFSFAFTLACGDEKEPGGDTPGGDIPGGDNPGGEEQPEEKKFTVKFETGCEVVIADQEVKENETATKPADPEREGYKFAGWYNGEAKYTFAEKVTANITLTAKWDEIKKFTIKFVVNGEVIYEEQVEEGKSATAPEAPVIEGAEFSNWEGKYTNVTADAEIVAVYDYNQYAVLFMVDGKPYGDPYEVEYGKDCEKPLDPEKVGYTFAGWDKEFTNVKEDLVINAKFELVTYNIKYYSGDTEITTLEPKQYTIEEAISFEPYNINDYYFFGWYNNKDLDGESVEGIEAGTTGDLEFYALNVKVDINGGVDCWSTEFPSSHDAGKGINEISNLPEIFEMDFFKYLSDNNYLADSRINAQCQATTWAKFSGLNPIHNGDPVRIWNDTSTNSSGGADGYCAVFLYETLELNEDGTIKDIKGGFLGTEPYKTKYRGLLDLLAVLYQYKIDNSNYTKLDANTNATRALMAFVIDGYFYGTQGIAKSYFAEGRKVIPGVGYGYKRSGENVVKVVYTEKVLPTPVKDGFAFAGWYLDKECTKSIADNKATNLCTIYAKWEEIK